MSSQLTTREWLIGFLAIGITLLLCMSVSALYSHEYRSASVCFVLGAGLFYFFFRHRMVIFTIAGLTFLFVNVGMHNAFHPSRSGYLVTYGSVAGLLLLVWWRARKRAQLGGKYPGVEGMHKLFDKDHGDEL
jgi:hypothetical protein